MLLDLKGVEKRFEIKTSAFGKGWVHALNRVNLTVPHGRTLGLVGESGCGKTTLGKTVLGLYRPEAGEILFRGQEIGAMDPRQRRDVQKDIQMIFQDPFASLNPRKRIGAILERPLKNYTNLDKKQRIERIEEICGHVGFDVSYLQRFPHQFSGGQRQRIAIARAIILRPALVIADEPISALDVSIQAQILNLMMDLQKELGLTYLFITHDISVVKHISDQVAVMYLGQIVEWTDKKTLFSDPKHPYTKLLLNAVPDLKKPLPDSDNLLGGEIPSPTDLPQGCFFAARCPHCQDECLTKRPDLYSAGEEHKVRCFSYSPELLG